MLIRITIIVPIIEIATSNNYLCRNSDSMINWPGFEKDLYLFRDEQDPDKWDKQYYLNQVQSFYSDYLKGSSTVGYNGINRLELLKAFAEGRQPYTKVDVTGENDRRQKNTGLLDVNGNAIRTPSDDFPSFDWSNELWDVLSPANKIMNTLQGTVSKIDYEINADPLDMSTRRQFEDNKLEAWVNAKNQDKIRLAAAVAGINLPQPDFVPETPEDLDQMVEEFMPAHVRYVEQVIKHSFDISHWTTDTKVLFYRDLFIGNVACVRNEYDPSDGKVKVKYVSPCQADTQRSQYIDCRDSERAWSFYLMNVSELKQYFSDKPEEWFKTVANSFAGMFDNPLPGFFNKYTVQNPWGGYGYDSFKVCVGHFEWIAVKKTKVVESKEKNRRVVKEVPMGEKVESDKVVKFGSERVRLEAKWVVGTGEIFEYGPSYENSDCLTYKWIVLPGKSITEQLVPIYKNFMDLWEKYRELLRNAQGKIQVVDVDKLASVQGNDDNPQEAAKKSFRRFLATNKMLIRRVNAAGMPSQDRPIDEIDGGMGSLFGEIQVALKTNIELVEYITGLNPLTLGASPDPNAPVTTSQMAVNATSSAIRPIVDGYMRMYQGLAEDQARWIVALVRGNSFSRKAYEKVVGDYGVEALITASKGNKDNKFEEAQYGVKLTPRPNDVEKQWLLQNLQAATTPAQGGEREISTADANVILNMITAGTPVKTVQYAFEKARRKQEKVLMAKKLQLMQQQSQLNQQDAQVSTQARRAENKELHDQKMEQIREQNKGNVINSATQESIRKDKELEVQKEKNAATAPAIA